MSSGSVLRNRDQPELLPFTTRPLISDLAGRCWMPTMADMRVSSWTAGAVLAVMLPSWSLARLGETPEQCEDRYGAPIVSKVLAVDSIVPGGVVTLYRKSGLEIKVLYFNGTAGEVRFEKSEKDALGFAEEFSQTEIESLMGANGGGKEWQDGGPSSGGGKMWALIDQSAYAIYSKPENSLQFTTAEFYKKLAANIKIEEKKNLDGF